MYKAEQFQELTKQYEEKQLQKTKRIQEDIKLVEDALENLYIKIQNCVEKEITPPKYAEVNKILEKAVSDDLILNQKFFLDITNDRHTRIYYNKNDFDNRVKNDNTSLNDKQKEFSNKTSKLSMSDYEKHTSKGINKEDLKTPHTKDEFEENITKLLKNILGDKASDIKIMRY
jgi:hypothetical protein